MQIPLEPLDYPTNDPGPHTLLTTLPPEENLKRLQWLMSRFTGYVGVTNLMGAKFEATQASFVPVLEEVKARGLLFVDDGTREGFAAGQIASTIGLDYATANVQIDAVPSPDDITKAVRPPRSRRQGEGLGDRRRQRQARDHQAARAMGRHSFEAKDIVLIPVSAAVRSQRQS